MPAKELFEKAESLRNQEQLEEALVVYQEARNFAEIENAGYISAESVHMQGLIFSQQRKFTEAKERLRDAETKFRSQNDLVHVGAVLRDLALLAVEEKDELVAKDLIRQSVQTLEATDSPLHLAMSQIKEGVIWSVYGDDEKGEALILAGIQTLEQLPPHFFLHLAYYNLSEVQRKLKKNEAALQSLEKSEQILNLVAKPEEHKHRRQQLNDFKAELSN